jgi:hypothetical protein
MNIQTALNNIIGTFEKGDLPAAIATSKFPSYDVPMNKWSFFNHIITFLNGTGDARGFQQWNEVERHIVKGAHAFHILAPRFKKVEDKESGESNQILSGFIAIPVFRVEDTEGKPLEYHNLSLPDFKLLEVAEIFGVKVKAIPGNDTYLGCYSHNRKEISMATNDETVFFHELAHAADFRVRAAQQANKLDREIVAELSACSLAYLVGRKLPSTMGNHFQYIQRYAEEAKMSVVTACMKYFAQVEAVLNEIVKYSDLKEGETGETKQTQTVLAA